MKGKDFFDFAGCCVIAVAIIIAGYMIASKIAQIPKFPENLSVSTHDNSQQFGDYLTVYDVAGYLGISSEDASDLIDSGKLDAAIYKNGGIYIISKQALQEWINSQLGISD